MTPAATSQDVPRATPTAAGQYLRFAGVAFLVAAATAKLGVVATRRLAGVDADGAVVAGCALALVASLASALPLAFGRGPVATRALLATAMRLGAVLFPGLALALSGWFAPKPLLFWAAVCYLFLLAVDTRFALARAREATPGPAATTKEDATR